MSYDPENDIFSIITCTDSCTTNQANDNRLWPFLNVSLHLPASVNAGGAVSGSSVRQNWYMSSSIDTVNDTSVDDNGVMASETVGPMRNHPKIKLKALGNERSTETFCPSIISSYNSATKSIFTDADL